jgi:hypothetical protein
VNDGPVCFQPLDLTYLPTRSRSLWRCQQDQVDRNERLLEFGGGSAYTLTVSFNRLKMSFRLDEPPPN